MDTHISTRTHEKCISDIFSRRLSHSYRVRGVQSLNNSSNESTAESEGGLRKEADVEGAPPLSSWLQARGLSGSRRDKNTREAT